MENQFEFTEKVRKIIHDRLVEYFPGGFDTTIPTLKRTTHFSSFVLNVNNKAIGSLVTEYNLAGYKIDDSREYTNSLEFLQSERQRLIDDLINTPNIVEFIVVHFYFSA